MVMNPQIAMPRLISSFITSSYRSPNQQAEYWVQPAQMTARIAGYWYSSALPSIPYVRKFRSVPVPSSVPPVRSTKPLLSNVAVCDARAVTGPPVARNAPVTGSKSSAERSAVGRGSVEEEYPPATNTVPLFNRVAVCEERATNMLPVEENVPRAGS